MAFFLLTNYIIDVLNLRIFNVSKRVIHSKTLVSKNKIRLDQLLVLRGLFPSRTRAQAEIMAGKVLVNGQPGVKAGDRVANDVELRIIKPDNPYVSRGGLKLEGALDHFGIDPAGWNVLDIGASTGGFTDCLLKRGAAHVTALDVGKGLIAWSLRTHSSVTLLEKINARNLSPDQVPGPFDCIVIDVSFISLKLILPNIPSRMKNDGVLLALIKPQFEAGKGKAPKGVVKDPDTWRNVLDSFVSPDIFKAQTRPDIPALTGFMASPITGRDGNREFFGCWKNGSAHTDSENMEKQIDALIESISET